ncbi:MAG: ribosomal L7Ae/L30e/S12e/Gadd45 family protein [Lachnospiraceae bacterium]|nr:ribosomal L7Ae/L30e/S12e/Gadd45 family protein [Lachnospiraceae bacterium]
MNSNKALSLLGIAQKAHAVASGNFAVEQAVRSGDAKLVIVTEDASNNAKKDLSNITFHYGVPLVTFGTKETLGTAIGKGERVCAALLTEGFADAFRKAVENK